MAYDDMFTNIDYSYNWESSHFYTINENTCHLYVKKKKVFPINTSSISRIVFVC